MTEIGSRTGHKREEVVVQRPHPFNAETPAGLLRESFLTPTDLFYVRSHGTVPAVDLGSYKLSVSGLAQRPLELGFEKLREEFPRREMTATLFCAGNRRRELMKVTPMPGKVPWGGGATGTARWAGVLLGDVLRAAGVGPGTRHVAFEGLDRDEESGTGTFYGGSIPLEKALGDNVLLAYEMNGEPLAPEHGHPLRVVVGGFIGARSVKWLSGIELRATPSDNHYQAREYKLFPSHVTAETADYSRGEMLGEIPLNAVICDPAEGARVPSNPARVLGYALAGGDHEVAAVEVSADGGRTWARAGLSAAGGPGVWRFWEAALDLAPGPNELVARAVAPGAGAQPEKVEEVWNFQGYANNAWHRVQVELGDRTGAERDGLEVEARPRF